MVDYDQRDVLKQRISRRRALVLLAALGGAAAARPLSGATWRDLLQSSYSGWTADQDALLQRFHDSLDANVVARLGEEYLDAHPNEADPDRLVSLVTAGWPPGATIAEAVRDTVKSDFEEGRTESVALWIVSQTEARLFAALSLTQ
jgi:hypothetical protein